MTSSFSHYRGNGCSCHLFCKQARWSTGPHTSDTGWNTSNWANKTWTMWVSVFLTQISSFLIFSTETYSNCVINHPITTVVHGNSLQHRWSVFNTCTFLLTSVWHLRSTHTPVWQTPGTLKYYIIHPYQVYFLRKVRGSINKDKLVRGSINEDKS